ncbi:hypothetical protein WJX72_001013 [[Myrmecia] bisecta]|uniref:Uncharacterized protein n=1 Tax=[Myrmecia] bisecta TaxID=41462 RepID=A0AAW1QNU3_9CHLO
MFSCRSHTDHYGPGYIYVFDPSDLVLQHASSFLQQGPYPGTLGGLMEPFVTNGMAAPLTPDRSRGVRTPPRSAARRLGRWLRLKWFQCNIVFGPYMFDWWERILQYLMFLLILALVVYGGARQAIVINNWCRGECFDWVDYRWQQLQDGLAGVAGWGYDLYHQRHQWNGSSFAHDEF